jgi:hypothetical protein
MLSVIEKNLSDCDSMLEQAKTAVVHPTTAAGAAAAAGGGDGAAAAAGAEGAEDEDAYERNQDYVSFSGNVTHQSLIGRVNMAIRGGSYSVNDINKLMMHMRSVMIKTRGWEDVEVDEVDGTKRRVIRLRTQGTLRQIPALISDQCPLTGWARISVAIHLLLVDFDGALVNSIQAALEHPDLHQDLTYITALPHMVDVQVRPGEGDEIRGQQPLYEVFRTLTLRSVEEREKTPGASLGQPLVINNSDRRSELDILVLGCSAPEESSSNRPAFDQVQREAMQNVGLASFELPAGSPTVEKECMWRFHKRTGWDSCDPRVQMCFPEFTGEWLLELQRLRRRPATLTYPDDRVRDTEQQRRVAYAAGCGIVLNPARLAAADASAAGTASRPAPARAQFRHTAATFAKLFRY